MKNIVENALNDAQCCYIYDLHAANLQINEDIQFLIATVRLKYKKYRYLVALTAFDLFRLNVFKSARRTFFKRPSHKNWVKQQQQQQLILSRVLINNNNNNKSLFLSQSSSIIIIIMPRTPSKTTLQTVDDNVQRGNATPGTKMRLLKADLEAKETENAALKNTIEGLTK